MIRRAENKRAPPRRPMSSLTHQEQPQEPPEDEQLLRQEEEEHDEACPESLLPRLSVLSCHCSATAAAVKPVKRRRLPVPSSPPPPPHPSPPASASQTPKTMKRPCCSLLDQEDVDFALRDFNKISLPSPDSSLWRTTSNPVTLKNVNDVFGAPNGKNRGGSGVDNTSFASPEKLVFGVNPAAVMTPSPARSSSSSLPPKPPLQRTVSDPTSYQTPGSINSLSGWSSSSGGPSSADESTNSRRLKRMKHRLKEMRKWWDHVMSEACEGDGPDEQGNTETPEILQQEKCKEAEEGNQEAVSVGVIGNCLSLDFNCPCGKGYQIVLSGRKCYYKLV